MSEAGSKKNTEALRLKTDGAAWKRWGPYLTERQWGTVREDYSPHGTAWEHVSHDMARSKACDLPPESGIPSGESEAKG